MKSILASLAILFCSSAAFAGIHLEPYLGYEFGKNEGSVTVGGTPFTVEDKLSGVKFGAKLGYSFGMLAAGADFMTGKLDEKDETGGGEDGSSTYTDMGAFVNVSLPVLFTFHATYFLSSKFDGDGVEASGSGFKIGAGYTGLPVVVINFDMINVNYDDISVTGQTVTSPDVDRKTYMLSVSAPFSF